MQFRVRLAAAVVFEVPVCVVTLAVRRRKETGTLQLRLAAGAHTVDRVTCAGCRMPTAAPVLCDDALHPRCEHCEPSASGRPRCRARTRKG